MGDEITFSCLGCDREFTVPAEHAGKRTKCPSCGATLTVPEPTPDVAAGFKDLDDIVQDVIDDVADRVRVDEEVIGAAAKPAARATARPEIRQKYAWVRSYLGVLYVIAYACFALGGVVAIIGAGLAIINNDLIACFLAIGYGLLIAGVGASLVLTIELTQVFLDIEENTRKTATLLESRGME